MAGHGGASGAEAMGMPHGAEKAMVASAAEKTVRMVRRRGRSWVGEMWIRLCGSLR